MRGIDLEGVEHYDTSNMFDRSKLRGVEPFSGPIDVFLSRTKPDDSHSSSSEQDHT